MTALVWAFSASPALAYNFWDLEVDHPPAWNPAYVGVDINTISFPLGSATQVAIGEGIEGWDLDAVPGSVVGVTFGLIADPDTSTNDGHNSISLVGADDVDGSCFGVGDIAQMDLRIDAFLEGGDPHIREGDIWLNDSCTFVADDDWFDFYDLDAANGVFDVRQVVLHEMGHLMGLDHEDGISVRGPSITDEISGQVIDFGDVLTWVAWPATMASHLGGDSAIADDDYLVRRYGVNEDDRRGFRALYDGSAAAAGNDHDVAVQSYTIPDDELIAAANGNCGSFVHVGARPSPHTDLLALALEEDPNETYGNCPQMLDDWDPGTPWPVLTLPDYTLQLYWGALVDAEFTYLNLGVVDEVVDARIVLTQTVGETCPSATCVVLYEATPTINVNTPFEVAFPDLFIPDEAPPGLYSLVMEVDPDDVLSERDEDNNRAVWNRQIHVLGQLPFCSCGSPAPRSLLPLGALAWLVGRRRTR